MVTLKRKVSLKEKQNSSLNTPVNSIDVSAVKKKGKSILFIVLLCLALLVCVVFLFKQCGSSDKDISDSNSKTESSTNLDSSTPIESFSNSSDQYIETMALKVIRGLYGNGQVRKDKLKEEYGKIQKRVNEILIK